MNVQSSERQLAKSILCEFMEQFQKRNSNLFVFSSHLHMDEQTPHIHIDFVPFICNSKRGLDTRVSLKGALAEQGFKGGTKGMTEWNQWMEAEKQILSQIMERHGIQWKQLGTHNKHLSVLDFEKQERQKEVAELERLITDNKGILSSIIYQQTVTGHETERMRKEGETIRQEISELSVTSHLLKEQTAQMEGDKEKLLSDNEGLGKQQKKLQQEINKMTQSKKVMERSIRAYDEDAHWQLPEPAVLMSAKVYRDKKVAPLVADLKEAVKNATLKYIQCADQNKRLADKADRQQNQISRLTEKVTKQGSIIDRLQEKADDLERVRQFAGADQVDAIVAKAKELEWAVRNQKLQSQTFRMSI